MSVFDIFILIGLVMQIIAGFILSVEVIGIERVSKWIESLSLFRSGLFHSDEGINRLAILAHIGLFAAIFYFSVFGRLFFGTPAHYPDYYFLMRGICLLALVCIIMPVGLVAGVFYGLKAAVFGLRKLEARTRARSSGILGFILLFIGFLLQFTGTLGQSLSK